MQTVSSFSAEASRKRQRQRAERIASVVARALPVDCPPLAHLAGVIHLALDATEGGPSSAGKLALEAATQLVALSESGIFNGSNAHPSLEDSDAVATARAAIGARKGRAT